MQNAGVRFSLSAHMLKLESERLNDGVYLWNRGGKFAKIKREGEIITLIDKDQNIVDEGSKEELEEREWSLYCFE